MSTQENNNCQKEEALRRMALLDIHEEFIKQFQDFNKVNSSYRGAAIFGAQVKDMIKEFEEKTGNLVYHVITNKDYDNLPRFWYDLLYVSPDEEKWDEELVCAVNDSTFYVKIETTESEGNTYRRVIGDNGALKTFGYYGETMALYYNQKHSDIINDR